MSALGDEIEPLLVVSTRGIGQPGWWIFKRLENEPNAVGLVDGPFTSSDAALREMQAMLDRRRMLEKAMYS